MKIIRYLDTGGKIRYGFDEPKKGILQVAGDTLGHFQPTTRKAEVAKILAPVQPPFIFCIGLNYRKHAEEGGVPLPKFPVIFMKSTGAVQNPDDPIVLPRALRSDKVDYECELAVVIGRGGKNIREEDALDHVFCYTCANDVSARDWQNEWGGSQWCRGKTFDTFAPLGPCLVTKDEIPDPAGLGIRTYLNGEIMQNSNTEDLIFSVPKLIAFLSGSTTLPDGAVILTGTPSGVGMAHKPPVWLKAGDQVEIEIDRIGRLSNPVLEEKV